jgi:imidazolonepropionase
VLADFLITNTGAVATCAGAAPRRGRAHADIAGISRAVVAARDGTIVFVGREAEWETAGRLTAGAMVLDAQGGDVVPGFVDAHTHLVFAGDRRDELRSRLAGATYADIAAAGGGIAATVAATRAASEDDLVASALPRLRQMLRCGTTTCEIKSGYGLTTESELKQLRAIARLAAEQPVDLVPTFMGAHGVPVEFRARRAEYVRLVLDDMLPAVARHGLAAWCDVFCETDVFSPDEARAILEQARRLGLGLRIHADELGQSGGARVAADLRVASADHLVFIDDDDARRLADAGTVATLLPAASFFLKLGRYAPARQLIEAGVPVALASDLNPGGGFSPSLPFVVALACFEMGLTFEEALVGVTLNAACSLGLEHRVGSLQPGRQMDAVVVDGPAVDLIRIGADVLRAVVKKGRLCMGEPQWR